MISNKVVSLKVLTIFNVSPAIPWRLMSKCLNLSQDFDNPENRPLGSNSSNFILTARRNNAGGIAPLDLNMQKEWVLFFHTVLMLTGQEKADKAFGADCLGGN